LRGRGAALPDLVDQVAHGVAEVEMVDQVLDAAEVAERQLSPDSGAALEA